MKLSKKLLSVLLAVVIIMTVIAPVMGFSALDFNPGDSTELAGDYSFDNKHTEYFTAAANEFEAQPDSMEQPVTITYNIDGGTSTVPDSQTFEFGSSVTTAEAPARSYNVTYNADGGSSTPPAQTAYYTFGGWKSSVIGNIVGASLSVTSEALAGSSYISDVTLTAQWTPDDITLASEITKTGYTFTGWYDGALKAGDAGSSYTPTKNTMLTAGWSINSYTVMFVNEDGTLLQSGLWNYGTTPSYGGETPQKDGDDQYSYTFSGWTPDVTAVTGDAEYTAQFTPSINKYTVTWKNYNGTVIETDTEVPYGTMPSFDGETPQKAGNAQYSYTFIGWTPQLSEVTGNVTYTAKFTMSVNTYCVTWKNFDGSVLERETSVPYGTRPAYAGSTPQRDADAQFTYLFSGWSPNVTPVTGDAEYTAQYVSRVNKYTVTWLDDDGTVLKTDNFVPYGTVPENSDIPQKDDDAQYIYTFSSWSPEITAVTGNAVYTAVYDTQLKKYNITFVDETGRLLQSSDFDYGSTPRFEGTVPAKDYTSENHFVFSGWSPEIAPVSKAEVYTVQYESRPHSFTYYSDGATHHGECECGYTISSQPHIPSPEGICTLCGASTAIFYIDFGDVIINEDGASGYDANGSYVTAGILEKYVVTQLNTSNKADHCINVVSGTHKVELMNLNIERKGMTAYAVSAQGASNATFIITGENHITSGTYRAGIDIALDAVVTIEGSGTLYVQSPLQAGIGGGNGKSNGTLIINSGEIYATGGIDGYSAGIGGGTSGRGGNITINGGYVVATGGTLASGIGGGNGFDGGNITINGGTVTAAGGSYGAGIGGGYTANGGNIVINGGTVKATAGLRAEDIGNGYKCTSSFSGMHNAAGNEVSLHILDAGSADRVYFGGVDTEALRHHPDDNNYYFFTDSASAVTAYGNNSVKFCIGENLTETTVYAQPCIRAEDYLLANNTQNITTSGEFTFADGELVYAGKVIDRAAFAVFGDVNLDGNIDGEDSLLANCIVEGLLTRENFAHIQYAAADYNLNGEITSDDVLRLEESGLFGTVSDNTPETDSSEEITSDSQDITFFDCVSAVLDAVKSKFIDLII